jgi:hypothetical protein
MVHAGQEVIIISGSHALHQHEKLAVAVSKAMRSHSIHETKTDGRFHVRTKPYLDGAILREVCWITEFWLYPNTPMFELQAYTGESP